MEKLTCAYCNAEQHEVCFAIGASLDSADWVMWEGTGKTSCPDCYDQGKQESKSLIDAL